jgi:type IV pilus assembly protein PilQ
MMKRKILAIFFCVASVVLPAVATTTPETLQDGNAWEALPADKSSATDFTKVNLRDALRILAKWANRSVILSPAVNGLVTLHLQNTPPAEVFDFLLKVHGLKVWQSGTVWYVSPAAALIKQKQEEVKWRTAVEEAAPLVTQLWQLRYAKVDELAHWLQAGSSSWLSKRGQLHLDARTNILCVQDTRAHVALIQNFIKRLDVPVQQVLIEARLASVDSDYEQELGVRFSNSKGDLNEAHEAKKGFLGEQGQFSLAIIRLADSSLLDVKLTALENQGHGALISSPSLFTASQQTASIEAGEEIPYQEASSSGATSVVFKKAVLSLKVTPQILPGKKVLLQLQVNQDTPSTRMVLGVPAITTRQIITNIVLPSGHTAVLGGIYESTNEDSTEGFPFLSKLPVLAWFFQVKSHHASKRELLVFVTPKIVE